MQKRGNHLCQFIYTSLTHKQDGGRQHALEKFGASTLVYPPNALVSNDRAYPMQCRAITCSSSVPRLKARLYDASIDIVIVRASIDHELMGSKEKNLVTARKY
jgi:hypothetical protein